MRNNRALKNMTIGLVAILLAACGGAGEEVTNKQPERVKPKSYEPRMVGDIPFDEKQDDPEFEVCHAEFRIVQYFALGEKTYEGEKIVLDRIFHSQYDASDTPDQSGLVRIRFIVNCKGETGRFRIQGMNQDYDPMTFDQKITGQLLRITQSLDQWKIFRNDMDRVLEYYQYLIFKIEGGELIEIMP